MQNNRTINQGYLPPDKYLKAEEIAQLYQMVCTEADQARKNGSKRGIINWMLIEIMFGTGLRAEEVCNLQIRDLPIYHGKDVIQVRQGKGDEFRVVNVKQSLKDKLAEYIRFCRKGAKPGSPLFVNENGQRTLRYRISHKGIITKRTELTARLSYHELYMRLRRIGNRAGLGHLHPHKFRHTFLSFLYKVGKDLRNTQNQAGHKRPETTARYAHVFDDDARRQTEALYAEVYGLSGKGLAV
jgi:integrase/recombinase XerC